MRSRQNWICAVLTLSFAATLAGCGSSDGSQVSTAGIASNSPQETDSRASTSKGTAASDGLAGSAEAAKSPKAGKPLHELFPVVTLETSLGPITLELDAEKAPQTVENFLVNYVERGYYEKTIFHYVEKGYIAATGGYTANGEPKEPRAPIRNEAHNGLKNVRGAVAMARHPDHVHSATSQFFINLVDNPDLDYQGVENEKYGYCVFGKVVEGMDIIDRLAEAPVEDDDVFVNRPVETVMIETVNRIR